MEVLVTVAITSIGLLGMGGLMMVSQRVNQDAYQRTQAAFVVQTLIESMRVNEIGVAEGAYDGRGEETPGTISDCDRRGCDPAQRARYDRSRFAHSLDLALPGASATLDCPRRGGAGGADGGLCRIEVEWSARSVAAGSDDTNQSLVWLFRP